MPIPKTIHQTFEYKNLSSDLQSIVNEWSIENPLFFYKMYDKTEREEFIKENFLPEVYDAYKRIKPGAFKADLWRYCILYKFGGFYADVDTLCFGNLEEFIQKDVDFVAPIDLFDPNLGTYNVANGFIGCIPNHPIMMSCIKRIVKWVELEEFPKYNLDFSGPGCMGKAINEHLGREENKSLIGYQGIHQRIMLIHFEPQTEYIRSLSNKKILQNKNGNSYIKNAYDEECKKNPNYIDWGKYHRFQDIVETNLYSPSLSISSLENYHNDKTAYFYLYKYCRISDCIRRGYRWEEHQHDIIDKYLTPNSIAVEVGSHIGTITVKLSKVVKKVYAFEPVKSSYNLLEKNLKLNNCHNVKIYQKEVNNKHELNSNIEIITLDSLNLEHIDFLKIDANGYEGKIIEGAKILIKKSMPLIIIDIPKSSKKLIKEKLGFLMDFGYIYNHEFFEDYVFVPPSLQNKKLDIVEQVFYNDNNLKIKIPKHNYMGIFRDRYNSEPIFRQIHTYLINNNLINNNIIDAGSWLGDNSIPWALLLPKSIIYSIDPSQGNLDFINLVAKSNSIENIKTLCKVLSDKKETVYSDSNMFHMTFNKDNGGSVFNSCTLDELLKLKTIDNIGYIHLDVEGFESNVIKGAEWVIKKYEPLITFEQHLNTDNYLELSQLLKNQNYEVYQIEEILKGNNIDCRNFIAFSKKSQINIKNIENSINKINLFLKL